MRVIRTDLFFEKPEMPLEVAPLAKAISAAWFKADNLGDGIIDARSLLYLPSMREEGNQERTEVTRFLSLSLLEGLFDPYFPQTLASGWVKQEDLIAAFGMEVIIEQSPPIALPLSKLLSKAP